MDNDLLPFLVDRLRRLRGLSFRELSSAAGISSPSNLREWLLGLPARLSAERIGRVLMASGLDRSTGSLQPGIHRWRIGDLEIDLLREILPILFPDRLKIVQAVPAGVIRKTSWLLLVRGSVRVLVEVEIAGEEEIRTLPQIVKTHLSGQEPGDLPRDLLFSGEEITRLSDPDLSLETLDILFGLSSQEFSTWTYERLFERLWADGIEPSEAARRLGFF